VAEPFSTQLTRPCNSFGIDSNPDSESTANITGSRLEAETCNLDAVWGLLHLHLGDIVVADLDNLKGPGFARSEDLEAQDVEIEGGVAEPVVSVVEWDVVDITGTGQEQLASGEAEEEHTSLD